jgi:hypothetical protein
VVEPRVTWEPTPVDVGGDYDLSADELPEGMTLDWCGGFCPVQAEGEIDGRAWYFRARGEHWQFHVSKDQTHRFVNDLFFCDIEWPEGPYMAGYMSPVDVLKCLHLGVALYRQQELHQ